MDVLKDWMDNAAGECSLAIPSLFATNTGTSYPTDKREQPLWQAIGLAADPGGTFDIGFKVTTANTGAAGRLGLEVLYVDNGS